MFTKNRVASVIGECLGTAALTLVVLFASRASQLAIPYFIALATGLAAVALVFAFNRSKTGAHLNPAITLGMWTIRRIGTIDAVFYIAFQMFGAFLAYLLFTYFVNTTLPTATLEFTGRVMVAEAVGTFVLAFGWAAAMYRGYKGLALSAAVGLSYAIGIMIASVAAAGILNPAVALGNHQWQWGTFVLGPVLGSLIGFNLYALLFAQKDEVIVPTGETAVITEKPVVAEASVVKEEEVSAIKPLKKAPRTTKKVAVAKKPTRAKRIAK